MCQFGLKLWSSNKNYINEAQKLYVAGIYQYIELYIVSGSYNNFGDFWKNLNIPYILHAPHFLGGLNLAKKENRKTNFELIKEVIAYADKLNTAIIIFHPGVDGDIEEIVRQINEINDRRIFVENKPHFSIDGKLICNGNSPEQIKFILDNTCSGFCLDIAHAIYAANSHGVNSLDYLKQFIKLNPGMYHFTDGDYDGISDRHEHLGKGSFPIKQILNILPHDCMITIETVKDSKYNLDDFAKDVEFLKNCQVKIK